MSEEFLSYFVLNYSSSSFFFLPRSLNPSPPAPRDATAMLTHPQMLVASPVFALSLFLEVEVLDTLLLASGVDVAFGVLVGVFVGCVVGIVVGAVVGVVVGAVVGGLLMLIPAIAKVKLNASEMVCSLMLNYVVLYVIMNFLSNVFADRSQGSTQTYPFLETAKVAKIVPGTELTWGFAIAIIATILVGFFMYRTRWGYTIRMIGINESFSKYSGMKVGGVIVLSQVIGGVLSGMGGAIEVLGRYNTFLWKDLPGYGWTGITVAILAKNNPLAIPFAALFIAYLNRGCELMSIYAGVPAEMIDIIQAVIFLFFAAEQFMSKTRQKMVVKETKEELAKKQQEAAVEGGNA